MSVKQTTRTFLFFLSNHKANLLIRQDVTNVSSSKHLISKLKMSKVFCYKKILHTTKTVNVSLYFVVVCNGSMTEARSFSIQREVQLRFLTPEDIPEVKKLCAEWFPIE